MMKMITSSLRWRAALLPALCALALTARAQTNWPTEWIDPSTGHRVIQLSHEPGSESLYFNLNPFTPGGKEMVFTTPNGISIVNLKSRRIKSVVRGRARVIMVGRKTGLVYYYRFGRNPYMAQHHIIYAANLKTGVSHVVVKLPPHAMVDTINANETIMAGTITLGGWPTNRLFRYHRHLTPDERRRLKGEMFETRFNEHLPMELFFLNLKTGRIKTCERGTNWLNHLQFSPTDPHLLMFCHEGPWQDVNRIWTIRTDGTHLTLVQKRTMIMEIAGHEFWSADGKTIWYDLQTPRGQDFWLAGYNVYTGVRTWYHLQGNEWSVHYNVSPDGKLFCGDGGDSNMVAHATNGKWLYLFHPELVPDMTNTNLINESGLIRPGVFKAERLVNMARHNYGLEPNAMFSPNGKWIIFRSNMSGASQVYEVKIKKADAK